MGRCPKPRKFFEKNLTKNFHTWKVFGVHIRSNIVLLEFYANGRSKPLPYRRILSVGVGVYDDPNTTKKIFVKAKIYRNY